MNTTILEYWNPKEETVKKENGYMYVSMKQEITDLIELDYDNKIELFETFYKMNNRLRYCNGSYYKFQNKTLERQYNKWLQSDNYKEKSFNLYYGNGVVD